MRNGFTLIELLVVVTLIGLILGGGAVSYGTFNKRQTVITSGKQLLVDLRQAQNKMNAGIKTVSGCSNTTLAGYRVRVLSGAKDRYDILENYVSNCASGGSSPESVVKTVILPIGVTFASAFTLTFQGQSGSTLLSTNPQLVLKICNNGCVSGSVSYSVAVNQSGLIEDKGTQ